MCILCHSSSRKIVQEWSTTKQRGFHERVKSYADELNMEYYLRLIPATAGEATCYGLQKRHLLLMLSHALDCEVLIIMFPWLLSMVLV